jgi:ECF sigma factor
MEQPHPSECGTVPHSLYRGFAEHGMHLKGHAAGVSPTFQRLGRRHRPRPGRTTPRHFARPVGFAPMPRILPLVYDELRQLAAQRLVQEQPCQTLQATALVHEAYLRLVDGEQTQDWDGAGNRSPPPRSASPPPPPRSTGQTPAANCGLRSTGCPAIGPDRPEKNRYGFGPSFSHYVSAGTLRPATEVSMTALRPDNEAIFHAARDIPDPEFRRECAREACGGDEARIAHVEALLAAAAGPEGLLDRPAAGTPVCQPSTRLPRRDSAR